MIYGLLLAMAVCGKNQVLGATPEGSDTIFMRFENYSYGRRGDYIDSGIVYLCFDPSAYNAKGGDFVTMMVEIETDQGKFVRRCSGRSYGNQGYGIAFGDSLKGRDFTVKMYNDPDGNSDVQFRGVKTFELKNTSAVELSFHNCNFLQTISVPSVGAAVYGGDGEYWSSISHSKVSEGILKTLNLFECPKLRDLNCANNQLTELDLSRANELRSLKCDDNLLTSLDVSQCPSLEILFCRNNQLTSLDASQCPGLKDVRCHNNQLTSLEVSCCMFMEYLFCHNNQLTSLNVSGCMALWRLDCRYNQLASLDVSFCPNLGTLLCNDNELTSLELGLHNRITQLDCSNNRLEFLDMHDISHITVGWCRISGNHMLELLYTGNTTGMEVMFFDDNCFQMHKCFELSKFMDINYKFWLQGNSQRVPVSLGVKEHYDLHADMELDGVTTRLRVTRKGGGYLDPALYSVENGWLSFSEEGEYTVEMTNPKVRDHIVENDAGWPVSTDPIIVFLDVRVGMPAETTPDNPSDPTDPDTPDNPTTANEALETLTAALQVYPNPASDVLHVELLSSAASESLRAVRVLSQSGHLCHNFGSGFDNLPVADLPAGLYFIEAETTTGTVLRQKFVKR